MRTELHIKTQSIHSPIFLNLIGMAIPVMWLGRRWYSASQPLRLSAGWGRLVPWYHSVPVSPWDSQQGGEGWYRGTTKYQSALYTVSRVGKAGAIVPLSTSQPFRQSAGWGRLVPWYHSVPVSLLDSQQGGEVWYCCIRTSQSLRQSEGARKGNGNLKWK